MAIREFRKTARNVVEIRAVDGEGGMWNFVNALCRALEIDAPNSNRVFAERGRIAEAIGCETMLIVDEAQYLVRRNTKGRDDWEAFEWLWGMAEDGMVGLAFCGHLNLTELETACPSLWRRLKPRVIKERPSKSDRMAIACQWGIGQPDEIEALLNATRRTGGAFGDIADVCKEIMSRTDGDEPSMDHLLAALESLGMQPSSGDK